MKTNASVSAHSDSNPSVENPDRLKILETQVRRMASEHASELASITRELAALRGNGHYNGNGTSLSESAEATALTDRRGMMKKMAGLAVGVAAVGLLKPTGAKASSRKYFPDVTGGNMIIGNINTPTAAADRTVIQNPGTVLFPVLFVGDNFNSTVFTLPADSFTGLCGHVDNGGGTPTSGNFYGVYGQSNPTAGGTAIGVFGLGGTAAAPIGDGVKGVGRRGVTGMGFGSGCGVDGFVGGTSTNAYGVLGQSTAGVGGAFVGGRCAVILAPGAGAVANPNTTPPDGGGVGDVYCGGTNGSVWYRTNADTNPYRRLADDTTAGALTLLATPVRYVDTRVSGGAFSPGEVRSYNFATLNAGTIPGGATGIVGNIVGVDPNTTGNLQIDPNGAFPAGSAAVLNFNPGQDIANHFVSALGANLMFVKANPNGGSVQLVIDIYGYYL